MFSSGAFGELLAQLIKHTLGPIVASAASHEMQTLFETQYAMGEILDGDGYRNGLADRTRQCRNWSVFRADHPLLLTPLLMRPAYSASYDAEPGGFEDIFRASIYCCSINFLGLPAGNLTTGIVDISRPASRSSGDASAKTSSSTQ